MEDRHMFTIPVQYSNTVCHLHDGLVVRCGGCIHYSLDSNSEPCKSCIKCRFPSDGSEGVSAFEPIDRDWYDRLKKFVSENNSLIDDIVRDSRACNLTASQFAEYMEEMERICKLFGAEMPEPFKKYADTEDTKNVYVAAKRTGVRMVDINDQVSYRRYQLFQNKVK